MTAPDVSVRAYRPDDLAVVLVLEEQLFGTQAWSASTWSDLVAGPGRRAVVAVDPDGEVVGHALTGIVGDFAELLRIGVRSDRRRLGVAARLLAVLTEAAGADGADRMLLEVSAANTAAQAFYARAGFEQIDVRRGYYRDGSDALVLQRAVGGSERMGP